MTTSAKKEVDFNSKLVSSRGGPRAASVSISHAAQITQWAGKTLPEDQTWHLIHYGKSLKVVNEFGEEREGEGKKMKLVPLIQNPSKSLGKEVGSGKITLESIAKDVQDLKALVLKIFEASPAQETAPNGAAKHDEDDVPDYGGAAPRELEIHDEHAHN